MKVIGVLDHGHKKNGFIIVQNDTVALEVIIPFKNLGPTIKKYIIQYKIQHIYIGLPVNSMLEKSSQSIFVKNSIHKIRHFLINCTYSYVNERKSTKKAKELQNLGLSKKPIDILAARIIWRSIER